MQVERTNSDALVVNKLPDGSTVIVDKENDTVFALNATAGAAWDACSNPTNLAGVTDTLRHTLSPEVNEEFAEEAIRQLQDKNLVKTSSAFSPTRRQFFATLSAVALPLVVALSIPDQKAYATVATSRPPTRGPLPPQPLSILPLPPIAQLPPLPPIHLP
jgi:hypothetical protein